MVRHVKAHVTGENRKHMTDKIQFNTDGNDKTDELAKMFAGTDKSSREEMILLLKCKRQGKTQHQIRFFFLSKR